MSVVATGGMLEGAHGGGGLRFMDSFVLRDGCRFECSSGEGRVSRTVDASRA